MVDIGDEYASDNESEYASVPSDNESEPATTPSDNESEPATIPYGLTASEEKEEENQTPTTRSGRKVRKPTRFDK